MVEQVSITYYPTEKKDENSGLYGKGTMKTNMGKKSKKKVPLERDKLPPAGQKIVDALIIILRKKAFSSITIAEIAEVSGVNESLIYRYFGSKRELLHIVLLYQIDKYIKDIPSKVRDIKGSLNKIRKIIRENIFSYQQDRVFAKILLLEVRNYPGYFQSDTYRTVQKYARFMRVIIDEGVKEGDIRNDVSSWVIMQIIMSGIEHLSMPTLLFRRKLSADDLTDNFCKVLFEGIQKQ